MLFIFLDSPYDSKLAIVNANAAWTRMSEDEKSVYKKKANEVKITQFHNLPGDMQDSKIKEKRKQLEKLVLFS